MLRKLIYYLIRILLSWRWTSVPVPSWDVHGSKQYGLLRLPWKVWHRWHVIDFYINDLCIALVTCAALHSEAHHYASTLSLTAIRKSQFIYHFFSYLLWYIGYYCPLGSISPKQLMCGGSQVYCPQGSGEPIQGIH